MGVAHNGLESERPLLGQLLVDAGLLSASDLQTVLERQRETGLPLGRMLVDEGFVPAHSVAMALAEQHGGLLKTEYGFATGQRGTSGSLPAAAPLLPTVPTVPTVPAEPAAAPFPLLRVSLPEEEIAPEPAPLPVEPAPVFVAAPEVVALAPEPAVVAPDPELAGLRVELGAAQTQIDELNELLERRTSELEASAARVREAEAARDEALADLTGAREQIVVLETSLEEAANVPVEPPPRRVYADDRHTLFVPGPGGYAAVDRSGPAPEVGSEVEMSGGERFRVVRIGPSPLPGEAHPRVYLDRVGPSWAELA
jgi:hypothetical protein